MRAVEGIRTPTKREACTTALWNVHRAWRGIGPETASAPYTVGDKGKFRIGLALPHPTTSHQGFPFLHYGEQLRGLQAPVGRRAHRAHQLGAAIGAARVRLLGVPGNLAARPA